MKREELKELIRQEFSELLPEVTKMWSKKSKANLAKALKKYKKGATVHYFPLSGGNYVVVGPKGVQTKDDGPTVVQIRKVGTFDPVGNPNQVSVGIDLNNGHEARWNGKEFEIEDLGVPLLLGKG